MKYFILLTLFEIFLFNCTPENCPENKGKCVNNICQCYEDYWTLESKEIKHSTIIYCDYKRKSRFFPLIFEFFLPIGITHCFRGKIMFFILKFILLLIPSILIFRGYFIFKSEKKDKIENQNEEEINLINKEENKEEKENKNNKEENNKENNKENEDTKEINKDNKNSSFFSDEENDNFNISWKLHTANHKTIPVSCMDSFLLIVEGVSIISFFIFHIIDLIGYSFAIYKDKNNVPYRALF